MVVKNQLQSHESTGMNLKIKILRGESGIHTVLVSFVLGLKPGRTQQHIENTDVVKPYRGGKD